MKELSPHGGAWFIARTASPGKEILHTVGQAKTHARDDPSDLGPILGTNRVGTTEDAMVRTGTARHGRLGYPVP